MQLLLYCEVEGKPFTVLGRNSYTRWMALEPDRAPGVTLAYYWAEATDLDEAVAEAMRHLPQSYKLKSFWTVWDHPDDFDRNVRNYR